jgi:hypothetical protein
MYFTVETISQSGGNRLVKRERPYRDGCKIDDTGSNAVSWRLECLFSNAQEEDGLEKNDRPQYPDLLDEMVGSCDVHETGDLMLPTGGPYRARFEGYERVESYGERDCGRVTFTFCADNEDQVGADSFRPPMVDASAKRLAEVTVFSAQSSAIWNEDLGGDGVPGQSLDEFLGQLEDLSNSPDTASSELADRAFKVRMQARRAQRILLDPFHPAHQTLSSPDSSRAERRLRSVEDMAGRAQAPRSPTRPTIVSIPVDRDRTLASIAVERRQNYEELLEINLGRVADPTFIEAGDVVRVFGS